MYRNIIGGSALLIALAACGGADQDADLTLDETPMVDMDTAAPAGPAADAPQARADFINDQGTQIGTATLTQEESGVRIVVDLAFLQAGERGFHIHEVGSCDTPSFESAGGHFNPTDSPHGFEADGGPHAGDFRNLEVETDDGTARTSVVNERITLLPGQPNSVLDADGSALIVHGGADDYTSQPSGDAGPRIACGVIESV